MINLNGLPMLTVPANCRQLYATPPDGGFLNAGASGYFRELAEPVLCEMPMPPEKSGAIGRVGVLLSPSVIKAAPGSHEVPAILVLSFFCHNGTRRRAPGFGAFFDNPHIAIDPETREPWRSLHKSSVTLAEQILFALDHPDKSDLALSTISSQPG